LFGRSLAGQRSLANEILDGAQADLSTVRFVTHRPPAPASVLRHLRRNDPQLGTETYARDYVCPLEPDPAGESTLDELPPDERARLLELSRVLRVT
jgi:hypothetical protein